MSRSTPLLIGLFSIFLLSTGYTQQVENLDTTRSLPKRYFSASIGYNGTAHNFVELGARYHVIRDERQATLDISGPTIGCEIGIGDTKGTVIPYLGWQGYYWGLAYGIRTEYLIHPNHRTFALSPEIGFSMAEFLRFTVGYRIPFFDYPEDRFAKFRLSIVVTVPFVKKF